MCWWRRSVRSSQGTGCITSTVTDSFVSSTPFSRPSGGCTSHHTTILGKVTFIAARQSLIGGDSGSVLQNRGSDSWSGPSCPALVSVVESTTFHAATESVFLLYVAVMAKLLRRSDNGSASGPSGWGGNMLSSLTQSALCRMGIIALLKDIVNNNLPERARQLLLASRLVALVKPGGGKLRPIAVGDVQRVEGCRTGPGTVMLGTVRSWVSVDGGREERERGERGWGGGKRGEVGGRHWSSGTAVSAASSSPTGL